MSIVEAISDQRFFRRFFKDLSSWEAWLVFLKGLFGLPIDSGAELELFTQCTGLREASRRPYRESYVICGRRSGKSFMSAIVAAFLATFRDWKPYLSSGEKGWIFIIATDREQAKIVKSYISGILNGNEIFKKMIKKESVWEIELTNNINIAVKTCNFRTIRGYTVLAAICEEIAFWRDENSANPAQEILTALRPSLSTIPDSILIGISTPYSRSGVLWEQYNSNFGNESAGAPLIWRAPTRVMNPSISTSIIDNAIRTDYQSAKAEWDAEWREDIEGFLSLEVIEAAVVPGRFELAKLPDVTYCAFIDPSGGRQDSFTLAICHKDGNGKVIHDCMREARPPFQPQYVVEEYSGVLKSYDISYIEGDRYAAEWVVTEFAKHGISVESSGLSSSEIYINFLPLIMNGSMELLEHRRLIEQLRGLERRTRVGGKDLISHTPFSGAHDDLAIAVAGAALRTSRYTKAFSSEALIRMMFPEPELSEEEEFDRYVTNWLLDRPQKPRKAEDG
jgi:hypothetical protein